MSPVRLHGHRIATCSPNKLQSGAHFTPRFALLVQFLPAVTAASFVPDRIGHGDGRHGIGRPIRVRKSGPFRLEPVPKVEASYAERLWKVRT